MTTGQTFCSSILQIEFSLPNNWVVQEETSAATFTQVYYPHEQGIAKPHVVFERCGSAVRESELAKILEYLLPTLVISLENFQLNQSVSIRQSPHSSYAVMTFHYSFEGMIMQAEKRLMPCEGERGFIATASAPAALFSRYAEQFALVLDSAVSTGNQHQVTTIGESYHGDRAWEQFGSSLEKFWEACPCKDELLKLTRDYALSYALWATKGADAKRWFVAKNAELRGLSPQECLKAVEDLQKLRNLLMSLPIV